MHSPTRQRTSKYLPFIGLWVVGLLLAPAFFTTTSHAQDAPPPTISRMVWSPDGTHLVATTGIDPTAQLLLCILIPPADPLSIASGPVDIVWLTFSPDNTRLAVNGTVYDTRTGEVAYSLTPPREVPVVAVAFSPDSQVVAYGDYYGWLHVADAVTGEVLHENLNNRAYVTDGGIQEPVFDIIDLAFSPDGKRLAAADWGSPITLWDTTTWEVLAIGAPYSLKAQTELQWSADGSLLLAQDSWGYPHLWETATMTDLIPSSLVNVFTAGMGYLADGRPYAIILDEAGTPSLRDLLDDSTRAVDMAGLTFESFDYPRIGVWANDTLTFLDADSARLTRFNLMDGTSVSLEGAANPSATTADGHLMAFIGTDGLINVWDGLATVSLAPPPMAE